MNYGWNSRRVRNTASALLTGVFIAMIIWLVFFKV